MNNNNNIENELNAIKAIKANCFDKIMELLLQTC